MTTRMAMSRRYVLAAGAGSLAAACGGAVRAPSAAGATGTSAEAALVRRWYAAWVATDWATVDALMPDDFTFSSAAGDDHISKTQFKAQCWDTQKGFIGQFEIESMLDNHDEAFVKYLCHTKNGKAFRNVEHFRFRGDQIASLECYFGEQSSFPSAVSTGQK
jgi:ketosteroid isomerase-like protein